MYLGKGPRDFSLRIYSRFYCTIPVYLDKYYCIWLQSDQLDLQCSRPFEPLAFVHKWKYENKQKAKNKIKNLGICWQL